MFSLNSLIGTVISKLTRPSVDKDLLLDSLIGVIPENLSSIDVKEERLERQ